MSHMKSLIVLSILFVLFASFVLGAKTETQLRLANVFSDNMVLQRNAEIEICGYGTAGNDVTVSFIGETETAKIDVRGEWKLKLKPRDAGGPYEMQISSGNEKIILKNVLVGDVWFCSGQSNMEWQLMNTTDGAEELKNFKEQDKIRLFTQEQIPSPYPLREVRGKWQLCNRENAQNFSAVAYFFGKKIYEETGIPVGLINSSWGGTPIEIWMDAGLLKGNPVTEPILKRWDSLSFFDWKKWNYGLGLDYKIEFSGLSFTSESKKGKNLVVRSCEECPGDLGGYWSSWAKPGSTATYKNEKENGIISGLIGFNAWAGAGTMLNNNEIFDLSGYDFIEFKVRGNGKFSLSLTQPSIEDFDYYSSRDFDATPAFKKIKIPISTMKQGGWGAAKPFTQNAIKQIQFNIKSMTVELPSVLFNGMVMPFTDFKIKGVVWYQGETNADRAKQYETLLPLMIKNWRDVWKQDIPFIVVQLPNFMQRKEQPSESSWAELREAQLKTMQKVQDVVTVSTIDLGDANDIHPRVKKPCSDRLAHSALVLLYGKTGPLTGPVYDSMEKKGDKIYVKFKNAGKGLTSKDGNLKGFAIAGADKNFKWAKAEIKSNGTIVVWSEEVKDPVSVRYAWADNPECNLYNREGLAAFPFRTDDWEGITEKNR
ncbi:MAG: CIA30 family protein [Candidatus Goldbacteria bacterium]|nr:CIA30 family protein [Candidatus Goldiibacteriota bacterium]